MFGWTVEDLCGKSRRRPLVTARQIGMYVFRELTDFSYPQIAEEFGGRDHTTVMYAVEKIKQQMTERHVIFDQVNELIARIRLGEQWIMLWTALGTSPPNWGELRSTRMPVTRRRVDDGGQRGRRRTTAPDLRKHRLSPIHRPYNNNTRSSYSRTEDNVTGTVSDRRPE